LQRITQEEGAGNAKIQTKINPGIATGVYSDNLSSLRASPD
jgi:hypothetical protein